MQFKRRSNYSREHKSGATRRDATPPSIRFSLLWGVNLTLGILLALFLVYEYHRVLSARVTDKRLALQEEASIVSEAVVRMRHHGREAVQDYIDAVCSQMQGVHSPGHHIVVDIGGTVLQSHGHRLNSSRTTERIKEPILSGHPPTSLESEEVVVGSHHRGETTVSVSEYSSEIRRSVLKEILLHLGAVAAGGVVAALVVNVILFRTVDKPLRRLVQTVSEIGRGRFGLEAGRFNSAELTSLAQAINSMSRSLAENEGERRAQMKKAREIQDNLLPTQVSVPGLRLEALYRPAEEVSGDYYDVFRLRDASWLICIADVVGHGVPAAMTAAMLKILLDEATQHHTDPSRILEFVNARLSEITLSGDFASTFLARWCPEEMRLQYAGAGHGSVRLPVKGRSAQKLSSTGLLLGVDPTATWETREINVVPGDRLLLMTDGVTETASPSGELFGAERIVRLLEDSSAAPLTKQVQHIDEQLKEYRKGSLQKDDLTLILMEITADQPTASIRQRKGAAV